VPKSATEARLGLHDVTALWLVYHVVGEEMKMIFLDRAATHNPLWCLEETRGGGHGMARDGLDRAACYRRDR